MINNTNGGVSVAKESEAHAFVYGIKKCILLKKDQQVWRKITVHITVGNKPLQD